MESPFIITKRPVPVSEQIKEIQKEVESLPTASKSQKGIVKIGSNIGVNSGTIYVPSATSTNSGVVKVNPDYLKIDDNGSLTIDLDKLKITENVVIEHTLSSPITSNSTLNITYNESKSTIITNIHNGKHYYLKCYMSDTFMYYAEITIGFKDNSNALYVMFGNSASTNKFTIHDINITVP